MNQQNEADFFREFFDARGYLETYYPESFDVRTALAVSRGVNALLSDKSAATIDITEIVKKFKVSHEVVENIVIVCFQKNVAYTMMQRFPKGIDRSIDIGGGPTVYQHIATSLYVDDIVHADFLESNQKEVTAWLEGAEDAYEWSDYIALMREIFAYELHDNKSTSSQHVVGDFYKKIDGDAVQWEANLRATISTVVSCDVFAEGMALPEAQQSHYKLVTANFVAESATGEHSKWLRGMKNILNAVERGGMVVITAIRNAQEYKDGSQTMPAVAVNEDMMKDLLEKEGFRVVTEVVLTGSDAAAVGYDGMVFVLAERIDAV